MMYLNRFYPFISTCFIVLLIIQSISFSGCIQEESSDVELVIAIGSDIYGYYPFMARDIGSISVNQNFFNALVEIDNETTGIAPSLATSWLNPNNVTWRFYLRENVLFHDGSLFTAEDVNFTLNYLKNLSFYAEPLSIIESIEVLDEYTIELKTTEPYPLLLYELINVNILNSEYMFNVDTIKEYQPVGTGPYQLIEHVENTSISVQRFDDYWKGTPDIKRAKFVVYDSYDDRVWDLINGSIDISMIPFEYVDRFSNSSTLHLISKETPNVFYIGFDFRINDSYGFEAGENPVSDLRVRKAIYHAINVSQLIRQKEQVTSANPLSQFVTPHTFGYNPSIERLPFNVSKARELIIEAGYKNGFSISIDAVDSEGYRNVVVWIAEQLKEINITLIPHLLPGQEYLEKLFLKNTSMYLAGFSPLSSEGTIRLLLHTSMMEEGYGIWNYGNYSNPEVDELHALITSEMDSSKRNEYTQDAFMIAMDDVAWIPLYSPKAFYVLGTSISWTPRHSNYILIDEISMK